MKPNFQRLLLHDLVERETGRVVCSKIRVADSWLATALGLIGRSGNDATPLLLASTTAIHTFGLQFELDIAFFDAQGRCLKRLDRVKPCRVALGPRGAAMTLETKAAQPSVLQQVAPGATFALTPIANASGASAEHFGVE